jgi:hypothetical protein
MSKLLKLRRQELELILKDVENAVRNYQGTVFEFKKEFKDDRKAVVNFTEEAWGKMTTLVKMCDKEIGWEGIAKRCEPTDGNATYIVEDILVYPQRVTGATVEADVTEYDKWKWELDDETFSNKRFHGHSHVNMGVTPSSTDLKMYQQQVDELGDDQFYIFMIINKKGDMTVKIYDKLDNAYYDSSEVTVCYPERYEEFWEEAQKMILKPQPTTITPPKYPAYSSRYPNYYGYDDDDMYYMGGGWDRAQDYLKKVEKFKK